MPSLGMACRKSIAVLLLVFISAVTSNQLPSLDYFNFIQSKCSNMSENGLISSDLDWAEHERKQAFDRCLVQTIPAVVRNIWTNDSLWNQTETETLYKHFLEEYPESLYQAYLNTIDEVFNLEYFNINDLPRIINTTYIPENPNSLKITLGLQLHAVAKYEQTIKDADDYLSEFAYYLAQLSENIQFTQLSQTLQNRMIKRLEFAAPSFYKFLHEPSVCLRNVQYKTSIHYRNDRSCGKYKYLFLGNSPYRSEHKWYVTAQSNGYSIRSRILNYYMYVEKARRDMKDYVLLWEDKNEIPPDNIWQVQIVDKDIRLLQDGMALCALDENIPNAHPYVTKHYEGENCLWTVEKCNY